MPLSLNVSHSKKIGLPNFSSQGACCSLGIELDGSLLKNDPEKFRQEVRDAFTACHEAVEEELARHNGEQVLPESRADTNPVADPVADHASATPPARSNGNNGSEGRPATDKQLDYVQQLSDQIHGLGIRRLESLTQKLFDKPVTDLQSFEASGLIDTLKEIKAGRIDLQDALSEVTTQ